MTSFLTPPTHVAILHRKPVGYHFCVGTRAGGSNSRSLIGSTSQNLTEILPAPTFPSVASVLAGRNVIAALSSLGSVLARSLSSPNLARFWPLNSCWPFKASSSLLLTLVNGSAKPTNGIANAFRISPISIHRIPSCAGSDRWNLAKDQKHEEPKSRES